MNSIINSIFGISLAAPINATSKSTDNGVELFVDEKTSATKNLFKLLNAGVKIFDDFTCNQDASVVLKSRLISVDATLKHLLSQGEIPTDKVRNNHHLLKTKSNCLYKLKQHLCL